MTKTFGFAYATEPNGCLASPNNNYYWKIKKPAFSTHITHRTKNIAKPTLDIFVLTRLIGDLRPRIFV